jgi:casein kinase I family protein HRR25
MYIINNKYKLIEKIGSGAFGSIYKGQNMRTNEYVAIKIEPIEHELKLLKNESIIYQYLKGCSNIPSVKWFGKYYNSYCMVINLLGPSLQDLIKLHTKLSLKLTLKIGIKILTIIKNIHERGLVHRDIKPDNFLFRLNDLNIIYLIDFGFCKRFIENNEKHIKIKQTNGKIGSKNYMSINSHNCIELSRRDDLESIGYMLLYLYAGSLPWNNELDDTKILLMKQNIINEDSISNVITNYIKKVKNLEFEENPNYNLIIDEFKREIDLIS